MSIMQHELILIDKLEDELIDNPDFSTRTELNLSLDETFQKKLNARAEQIASLNSLGEELNSDTNETQYDHTGAFISGSNQFLVTKSKLKFKYKDYDVLGTELNEWFSSHDLNQLRISTLQVDYEAHLKDFSQTYNEVDAEYELLKDCISKIGISSMNCNELNASLKSLLYFAFGKYGHISTKSQQLSGIDKNMKYMFNLGLGDSLIGALCSFMKDRVKTDKYRSQSEDLDKLTEENYFQLLTLTYFLLSVLLGHDSSNEYTELQGILNEHDLLTSIVTLIDSWKWKPNKAYRIRNLLFIAWKLILIEMGDSEHLDRCDEFLNQIHGTINKHGAEVSENKLTCSPLDYFTFREDLIDKYPLCDTDSLTSKPSTYYHQKSPCGESDQVDIERNYNYFMAINNQSNSLSNLIANPRPNKSHSVQSQLPAQTVHIATPVPSPPLTPSDYMSGGEKIRKSYQVNQGLPFIYPVSDTIRVPAAIQEADSILKDSVYESYSDKQLWHERQIFMAQERGFVDEYKETPPDDYKFEYNEELFKKYPDKENVIKSILRAGDFYSKNFVRLHSFVQVLVETIKAVDYDFRLNFSELELNSETYFSNKCAAASYHDEGAKKDIDSFLLQQVELYKIRHLTLKASSSIIILMLKWFKRNHVLKYYYLSSILFDLQYFNVFLEFLNKSFNNQNLQVPTNTTIIDDSIAEYEIIISQNMLMNPEIKLPQFDFFNRCLNKIPERFTYRFINRESILKLPTTVERNSPSSIQISKFNQNFCFVMVNLLNIANKILVKSIFQRIFALNEQKPSELFKMILMNYQNKYLSYPILKMLKKLIPYQGRKWKSVNMDLISMIYLNLKLSMKDSWLSGRDLENDFNNSYDQEIALRSLLQFYNIRNYRDQMKNLGYAASEDIDIQAMTL
ncbi:uncharacterized protein PRCAT00003713001 [Priceomyces carsonii]|uniref:uncharacterized protein n=1 Tax=Priceomyces carsonii TaxID=28549 RepID=UPI002ED966B8|nr:unnamed protein product [Priceomyces carsonii]